MNKSELVKKVQEKCMTEGHTLSLKEVNAVITETFDVVGDQMSVADKVSVPGFGSFARAWRKPRQGKNPRTGEPLSIPGMHVAKFKPAKALKEKLNGG